MASKRRLRRNSCEGKVKYTDFEEASQAAKRLTSLRGELYHPYKCTFCRSQKSSHSRVWHVGRYSDKQLKTKEELR